MPDKDSEKYVAVLVAASSAEDAAAMARTLVEEELAACGQVVGPVRSIYRWQGRIEDEPEALLILKTRAGLFEALKERVLELHGYDVPEVIALPLLAGHKDYFDWIDSCTRRKPGA